jgi:hypothetical protein
MHMATTAAAHAAAANALKASGALVRLEPGEWLRMVNRMDEPLIVVAAGGVFRKHIRYLTSYKGLVFWTQSSDQLVLPSRSEIISAKSISMPEV